MDTATWQEQWRQINWEKIVLIGIIAAFMMLSFLGGVQFLIELRHSLVMAQLEMGALEIGLLALMRGITQRKRNDKPFGVYTATEVYIVICLIIANSGSFLIDIGADKVIEWVTTPDQFWARAVLTLFYASAVPVVLLMLIWIWQDGSDSVKKEEKEEKVITWKDLTFTGLLRKDVLKKWQDDNGQPAEEEAAHV